MVRFQLIQWFNNGEVEDSNAIPQDDQRMVAEIPERDTLFLQQGDIPVGLFTTTFSYGRNMVLED
jgi:hypothetical protein